MNFKNAKYSCEDNTTMAAHGGEVLDGSIVIEDTMLNSSKVAGTYTFPSGSKSTIVERVKVQKKLTVKLRYLNGTAIKESTIISGLVLSERTISFPADKYVDEEYEVEVPDLDENGNQKYTSEFVEVKDADGNVIYDEVEESREEIIDEETGEQAVDENGELMWNITYKQVARTEEVRTYLTKMETRTRQVLTKSERSETERVTTFVADKDGYVKPNAMTLEHMTKPEGIAKHVVSNNKTINFNNKISNANFLFAG